MAHRWSLDLARMPHLLVAGTTGSGKSVAVNSMILSLLYQLPPDQCKLILIDPKMLELSVYDGIPHLLAPVVTEPSKAVVALKWTVREMEERYRAMSRLGVRNIAGYNQRLADAAAKGEELTRRVQTGFDAETGEPVFEEQQLPMDPLPLIVVVVDEMADLMLVAGKEIEGAIQRLAQMARAAGIHLIMATQRPSVDVITGTIKANFPTRISFRSLPRSIAEQSSESRGPNSCWGRGHVVHGRWRTYPTVHGPFVSDGEVERITDHLRHQGRPSTSTRSPTMLWTRRRPWDSTAMPRGMAKTVFTTKPWRWYAENARHQRVLFNVIYRSDTIGRRASSNAWRRKALSAGPIMSASARCWPKTLGDIP